jgi:hypothetical protein
MMPPSGTQSGKSVRVHPQFFKDYRVGHTATLDISLFGGFFIGCYEDSSEGKLTLVGPSTPQLLQSVSSRH